MATPLLSICIPSYTRAGWLKACLDSCLPQVEALPLGLVEVVVSDNASVDETPELLAEYASRYPQLTLNRNAVNIGQINFDTVIQCAHGEYAWLLGDDDGLLPGAIALVVDLIQREPRDFYLPHVVIDTYDPKAKRMEWFEALPRLDWNLSDPAEFLEYMKFGRSASVVFSFISILIFRREPWLEAVAARPQEFDHNGWSQVATALAYVKVHGRLRVIPEPLVNYHCSDDSWVGGAWSRAMLDLRGHTRIADCFFPHSPELHEAYLGNLRKNHGEGWISHLRLTAPDHAAWEESRVLLLKAGFNPLKVAAVGLGADLLSMKADAKPALDPEGLVLADLGFITRGGRRVLLMTGRTALAGLNGFLDALRAETPAEILILVPEASPGGELPARANVARQVIDLPAFSADKEYQALIKESLKDFRPELVINADPERHPAWDLITAAVGAMGALAFKAPERTTEPQAAAWLDSQYTRILPLATASALAGALGVLLPSELPAPPFTCEGPMKLNLGCGLEHLPGWVNVDQFPACHPDVVHDLERFPWPFPDGCAEEVLLKHVLEHLGRDSDTFLGIIRELYRVCAPGALVRIIVPHPRHQDFLQDPTHVRPVLPELFQHFSLRTNEDWISRGLPGTPLALYLELDFELQSSTLQLDPHWEAQYRSGKVSQEQLERAILDLNNVVRSTEVVLRAVKPFHHQAALLPVLWEGSQFVYHSLAHVNRQLCLGLLDSGKVDLSLLPYEPDQFEGTAFPAFRPLAPCVNKLLACAAAVHVRHQWPPCFVPPPQGAWVMIQPWEFGGIPAEWVSPMRDQVDEIWVPSTWVKDCYVKSGIPEDQVVVIPNGVDSKVFRPDGERFPLSTSKGCKFLFLGGTIARKGIDLLLEAYRTTFRSTDDVCLVIKGQGGGVYKGGNLSETLEAFRRDPLAPEIEYRMDNLEEAQIAALYRTCDVFVLPYRGEGFGLPIAEAMASGLPVIVTGRGAAMDFVTEDWGYLIPSHPQVIKSVDAFEPTRAGFWLEEPDREALGGLLRQAYAQEDERRKKGHLARAYAVAALGWDKPVALALARLEALALAVPRRSRPLKAGPAALPEAFLYEPDWAGTEWVEVLLSYLQAFNPGEAVALVLAWPDPAEPTLELAQALVFDLVQRSGWERFPDVVLVDRQEELPELLQGYAFVQGVPHGRGSGEGLAGPYGARLAKARAQLCQV
jgi:glycosyltransferase involved in cell wall biosynthesis